MALTHDQVSQAPQGTAYQLSPHIGFSTTHFGVVVSTDGTHTTRCNWETLGASSRRRLVLAVPAAPKLVEVTHQDGRMPVSIAAVRGSPATAPHLGLGPGTPGIRKSFVKRYLTLPGNNSEMSPSLCTISSEELSLFTPWKARKLCFIMSLGTSRKAGGLISLPCSLTNHCLRLGMKIQQLIFFSLFFLQSKITIWAFLVSRRTILPSVTTTVAIIYGFTTYPANDCTVHTAKQAVWSGQLRKGWD